MQLYCTVNQDAIVGFLVRRRQNNDSTGCTMSPRDGKVSSFGQLCIEIVLGMSKVSWYLHMS